MFGYNNLHRRHQHLAKFLLYKLRLFLRHRHLVQCHFRLMPNLLLLR
jgi:hypothetical protein